MTCVLLSFQTAFAKFAGSANRILVNFFVQRSELRDLYDKVAAGERISEADALRLFESKDLNAIGAIADLVAAAQGRQPRQLHHQPLHQLLQLLHPECQFCSFARKKRDADGFQLSVEEIVAEGARGA